MSSNSSSFTTLIPQATLSCILSIILIFFFFFPKLFKKMPSSNSYPLPPGPTPLPYIGCFLPIIRNRPTFRWIHKLMDDYKTQILCLRLGPSVHVIVITSPELARNFLKKQDAIFASRPDVMCAKLTSGGYMATILTPMGDQWKKMRKILSHHVLSQTTHNWLLSKRNEESDHLLRYISNQIHKSEGGLVNIRIVAQHYCGNLIRKMIFGKRFFGIGMEDGGPGEEEVEHVAAIFTILKYMYSFCITDYFPLLRWKTDLDDHEKIMRNAIQSVRKYQDPLIDERIRMWNNGDRKREDDLLDVLLNLDNPKLTIEEIKAQIVELMIATVDNPSNAVEWTIGEMIKEPLILKRAVEELDRVVGTDRLVQESDIPHLNYLKACIKEAFRLHPIAPFNPPHLSTTDTNVAGYFIPKGSHVLISRPGLGRNSDVWKDPMRFDPTRHLGDENKNVVLTDHELRMLSFSTGRRGCVGVLLGSTITTMLLARMVQGFTWEVPPNEPVIELVENDDDLLMAKPLVALASPRLARHLYPKN